MGMAVFPASLPVMFRCGSPGLAVDRLVDWFYAVFGGGWMAVKSRSKACCQRQDSGRRSRIRRALEAIRAGTAMSLALMVPVRALVKAPLAPRKRP